MTRALLKFTTQKKIIKKQKCNKKFKSKHNSRINITGNMELRNYNSFFLK